MNLEYAYDTPNSSHKYSDLWKADWREDIDWLAAEQKSTCALCGHEMIGTARELILAFREHRKAVHGQRVPDLKKKAEEKLLMLDHSRRTNSDGDASWRNGAVNSALSNKHTFVSLMRMRDDFFEEHGRMPTSKDPGFGSGSVFIAVTKLFGSWPDFQNHVG